MAFDQADYRRRVLHAYRGSKQRFLQGAVRELKSNSALKVPGGLDLTDLYDMPRGVSDTAAEAQVEAVEKAFGNAAGSARMATIGPALRTLHALLQERNSDFGTAGFWESRQRDKETAQLEQLRDLLPALQTASHGLALISRDRIAEVATQARHDPSLTVESLATLAAEAGLTVVPPAPKPTAPVPTQFASALAKSGCASVVDLIFLEHPPIAFRIVDGFSAEPLMALTIAQARASFRITEQRPSNDDYNMAQGQALQLLLCAVSSDVELAAFVYSALVEQAKRALQGAPPLAVEREFAATHLDPTETKRLILSVAGTPNAITFADVPALLAEGKVREARGVFVRLDAASSQASGEARDTAEAALAEREHSLTRLRDTARLALDTGDIESARTALEQALGLCVDDELEAMLRGLPPAAPRTLAALADEEGHVVLSWSPGFGSGEGTRYRVLRKVGSAPIHAHDGAPVGDLQIETEARDNTPPIGIVAFYGVAATHGSGFSPVAAVSTRVAPPVRNVRVVSEPTRLTIRWDSHPATATVNIMQVDPSGARTALEPNRHGSATSDGLVTGTTYTFAVTAHYRTESGETSAEPVRITGTPRGQARPMLTLAMDRVNQASAELLVDAAWRQLDGFEVEVWHFDRKPDWPYGSRVPLATIAAAGQRLVGRDTSRGTRQSVRATVPPGLRHYVACTRDGTDVIVGATEPLGICPPLQDVAAQRFQNLVVLSWPWPGPDFDVLVRWSSPGGQGERRLTQAAYRAEGGCRIPCGSEGLKVFLTTATPVGSTDWRSPQCVVEVPGSLPTVDYQVTWHKGVFGKPKAVALSFTSGQPVSLPITVVARTGEVMPFGPDGGVILHSGTLEVAPGGPTTLPTLALPSMGRHFWIRAFTNSATVRLSDPPVETLRGA